MGQWDVYCPLCGAGFYLSPTLRSRERRQRRRAYNFSRHSWLERCRLLALDYANDHGRGRDRGLISPQVEVGYIGSVSISAPPARTLLPEGLPSEGLPSEGKPSGEGSEGGPPELRSQPTSRMGLDPGWIEAARERWPDREFSDYSYAEEANHEMQLLPVHDVCLGVFGHVLMVERAKREGKRVEQVDWLDDDYFLGRGRRVQQDKSRISGDGLWSGPRGAATSRTCQPIVDKLTLFHAIDRDTYEGNTRPEYPFGELDSITGEQFWYMPLAAQPFVLHPLEIPELRRCLSSFPPSVHPSLPPIPPLRPSQDQNQARQDSQQQNQKPQQKLTLSSLPLELLRQITGHLSPQPLDRINLALSRTVPLTAFTKTWRSFVLRTMPWLVEARSLDWDAWDPRWLDLWLLVWPDTRRHAVYETLDWENGDQADVMREVEGIGEQAGRDACRVWGMYLGLNGEGREGKERDDGLREDLLSEGVKYPGEEMEEVLGESLFEWISSDDEEDDREEVEGEGEGEGVKAQADVDSDGGGGGDADGSVPIADTPGNVPPSEGTQASPASAANATDSAKPSTDPAATPAVTAANMPPPPQEPDETSTSGTSHAAQQQNHSLPIRKQSKQERRKRQDEMAAKLRFSVQPVVAPRFPGLANRRRIWNVCRRVAKVYLAIEGESESESESESEEGIEE